MLHSTTHPTSYWRKRYLLSAVSSYLFVHKVGSVHLRSFLVRLGFFQPFLVHKMYTSRPVLISSCIESYTSDRDALHKSYRDGGIPVRTSHYRFCPPPVWPKPSKRWNCGRFTVDYSLHFNENRLGAMRLYV